MDPIWAAEISWRVFEATGSVWAYLAYRRVLRHPLAIARLSLN